MVRMAYKGKHRRKHRYQAKHYKPRKQVGLRRSVMFIFMVILTLVLVLLLENAVVGNEAPEIDVIEFEAGQPAVVEQTGTVELGVVAQREPAPVPEKVPADVQVTVQKSKTAQEILEKYIRMYPILAGSTVEYGDARGYQAICYYRVGKIVVSRNHTSDLDAIIRHECLHIVDWRTDGDIDDPD